MEILFLDGSCLLIDSRYLWQLIIVLLPHLPSYVGHGGRRPTIWGSMEGEAPRGHRQESGGAAAPTLFAYSADCGNKFHLRFRGHTNTQGMNGHGQDSLSVLQIYLLLAAFVAWLVLICSFLPLQATLQSRLSR